MDDIHRAPHGSRSAGFGLGWLLFVAGIVLASVVVVAWPDGDGQESLSPAWIALFIPALLALLMECLRRRWHQVQGLTAALIVIVLVLYGILNVVFRRPIGF